MAYVLIRILAYISLGLFEVIVLADVLFPYDSLSTWRGIIGTVYVAVGLIPHKYVVKNTVFYWTVMCFFVAMFGAVILGRYMVVMFCPCMLQPPLALYMSRVRFIEAHRSPWRRQVI